MKDTVLDLLQKGTDYLERNRVENARLEAERLIAAALNMTRVELYLKFDRPCTAPEKELLRDQLARRAKGEPLQYILGYADFFNSRLKVRPGVLIPRPETELIIELARQHMPEGGFVNGMDIGCGSGALALTLLKENIVKRMVAVDISPDAIAVTRENAEAMELGKDRLRVVQANAFNGSLKAYEADGGADLIVSNPPYIRDDEWSSLQREITEYEPRIALLSGSDGLDAHRALAAALPGWLKEGGFFLGEIGESQGDDASRLHRAWSAKVELAQDLTGRDRVVIAMKM